MAKFRVYQIGREHRLLASSAQFYGFGENFTQSTAKQAFRNKKYAEVAVVEAASYEEVRQLINNDRGNSKILSTAPLRNINIGDIIYNEETNLYYIVGREAFERIKL